MEFLIVPVVFGSALLLLSLGKLLGKDNDLHSCKGGADEASCGSCSADNIKFYKSDDDPGFTNVAKLGNPNRKNRFIDKLDFKPERFN